MSTSETPEPVITQDMWLNHLVWCRVERVVKEFATIVEQADKLAGNRPFHEWWTSDPSFPNAWSQSLNAALTYATRPLWNLVLYAPILQRAT